MATFAVVPETFDLVTRRRVGSTDPKTGAVRRRQFNSATSPDTGEAELRVWILAWEYASRSDAATIEQYLVDTVGGVVPMDWTIPGGGSDVRVRIRSFKTDSVHPFGSTRITVELEEVL